MPNDFDTALAPPPELTEPPARSGVRKVFMAVHLELIRRAAVHKEGFALVWRSGVYSAAEFFAEAGNKGGKFMEVAHANVLHIKAVAESIGQTLEDYLLPADYMPPVSYTVVNGVVILQQAA